MGFGRILGGALQGVGAGIAEQGRLTLAQKHEAAMAAMRSEADSAGRVQAADLNDRNAQRSDARGDLYDARKTGRSTDAQITVSKAQGQIKGGLDAASDSRDLSKAQALARLQSSLGRGDAAYAAQFKQTLERGDIKQVVEGVGQSTIVFNDGSSKIVQTPGSGSRSAYAGGSVLDQTRGGGVAAAAPAPTATPERPAQQQGKTMSRADIAATAKARGLSERQAQMLLEKVGYRLAD